MSYPRNFPLNSGHSIGIIVDDGRQKQSNNLGLTDSNRQGNMCVWDPMKHSWVGVDPTHLGLNGTIRKMQSEIPRPLDCGSIVQCSGTTGSNELMILGGYSDIVNPSGGGGGLNTGIGGPNPILNQAFNGDTGYYPPTDGWQEVEKRGAHPLRDLKEKSKKYSHSMLQGLPSQASVYEMLAHSQPAKKNIETAKQHFGSIMGSGFLSGLPGALMSLGKMMNNLSSKNKSNIKKNMPPQTQAAFESMAYLLPDIETSGGGFYATDSKVNEDVFMENAISLMSQCTSLSDLCDVLKRVQTDESLYGLDQLPDVSYTYTGAFGGTDYVISANGNVKVANSNTTNATSSSKSSFGGFMSSAALAGGSPSSLPGQNMFGDSAGTIFDMMQRVFPGGEQMAKQTVEATNRLNKSINRNNHEDIQNRTANASEHNQWLA